MSAGDLADGEDQCEDQYEDQCKDQGEEQAEDQGEPVIGGEGGVQAGEAAEDHQLEKVFKTFKLSGLAAKSGRRCSPH